jgi:hypothetical protein
MKVHKKEEDEVSYESVGVRTEKGAVFSGNEGLVCQEVGVKHVTQIPRAAAL